MEVNKKSTNPESHRTGDIVIGTIIVVMLAPFVVYALLYIIGMLIPSGMGMGSW